MGSRCWKEDKIAEELETSTEGMEEPIDRGKTEGKQSRNGGEVMKKWYSLYDKIYRVENLKEAYKRVRRNHGAPGIDGETVEDFGQNAENRVRSLHDALKTKTYQPNPVRRVELEKPDGGIRKLGIPTVAARVVQQAIVNIIGPIFDADFHPSSFGFRPNRSQQRAVAKAEWFMNKYGLEHVVDMDLSKCFDTLNHEQMMKAVGEKISDRSVLNLIKSFLKSGVMGKGEFLNTEIERMQVITCLMRKKCWRMSLS